MGGETEVIKEELTWSFEANDALHTALSQVNDMASPNVTLQVLLRPRKPKPRDNWSSARSRTEQVFFVRDSAVSQIQRRVYKDNVEKSGKEDLRSTVPHPEPVQAVASRVDFW